MRRFVLAAGSALFLQAFATPGCSSSETSSTGTPTEPTVPVGELCLPPAPTFVSVRFEPDFVVLAPGQKRAVRVAVDPDFCSPETLTFTSENPSVVAAPATQQVAYGKPTVDLEVSGLTEGKTTVTVSLPRGDGTTATATLDVEVRSNAALTCTETDDGAPKLLEAGTSEATPGSVNGKGALANAAILMAKGADAPNRGSFLWSVAPFEASIGCAKDITPTGYVALGPAVTFGPADKVLPRDMAMEIPVNPARIPEAARWRHVEVVYSGPRFKQPRVVAVTNLRPYRKADGDWVMRFEAPRLGTYQVTVKESAGTTKRQRRLTHRAVIGVSMGGAGTAQFGLRHHNLFDVIAPLGGPVDWTWLANHLEENHTAGFRPIAPGTKLEDLPLEAKSCTKDADCAADERCLGVLESPPTNGKCRLLTAADEPYEHSSSFNTWWAEFPRTGNGGNFDREEYVQIFRDLSLMFGNPNGYNPDQLNLPAGVDPKHPSVVGDHEGDACSVYVDPLEGDPNESKQKELWNQCPKERCAYTQTLSNYYDDEFNPDGTFPVITFCDGSNQQEALSPWANTWIDAGNDSPMEVALAVDYNGNGKRDELEPVVRAGHEAWDDWGSDGTPSLMEAGYGPENLDPAGDDYDPQYNPTGTENDHRFQPGEPYRDFGLDGVANTASSPYDFGEGDGKFTVAPGLQRMWDYDPHTIARGWPSSAPKTLDDEAIHRFDLWTDGGTRDLFNFAVAARHLAGTFLARGRTTAFYSNFNAPLGLDPANPNGYNPGRVFYEDLPGVVFMRYGHDEPTEKHIEDGSGQHVGTANEVTARLQSALYFIGSRWPDAPKGLSPTTADDPAEGIDACQIVGNCNFTFTASDGRTGPVAISLPPGYAHKDLQSQRYPVIYMLHGYGMKPEDLQAAIIFLKNWMNGSSDSQHRRLKKAILVYVDGRCRAPEGKDGQPDAECIRGSFFTDSIRPDGPQMDRWWLELMDEIDKRYRTMGESTVEWTE
jgi:hypothetical protein